VRVAVTGAAGFVGGAVAKHLTARGDEVLALVRDPDRAPALGELGCLLVPSDLSDVARIEEAIKGCDGLIHCAGSYRVGIRASEHAAMWDANLGTTERVLDAGIAAAVPRIVYISTVGTFGNTRGRIVDESYRRDPTDGFVSVYDETKYRAHEAAVERSSKGAPIVLVQPGQVYGQGDHSPVGEQLRRAYTGRLRYRVLDDVGLTWVHVEDLAAGIVLAFDRAPLGESYVLTGPAVRLRDAIALAAKLGGHGRPRPVMPTALLRLLAPIVDRTGGLPGAPPNLTETIRASAGVTYWASADKARRELGFEARGLEAGLRDTFQWA
jgi:nucleoside-diphosphate-sugar epimerase